MGKFSLSLLGSITAEYDGRPLNQFRTRAVQALLVYLACRPEVVNPREALMTLLWPELPLKSGQSNLRHTLYHLRQAIPDVDGPAGEPVPFVLADRQTIRVNPDGRYWLDVHDFETFTGPKATEAEMETAANLYRGDFLADFYLSGSPAFESWAQSYRADLRRRLLDALARLTDCYLQKCAFEQAEGWARRQLGIDNLREEAHRQLMTILVQSGRRTEALRHYGSLAVLLEGELGISPSEETERLVKAVRRQELPAVFAAGDPFDRKGATPARPPITLAAAADPFIGRQAELAALEKLLADPLKRLITIIGPGGMGKTRLALAVGECQFEPDRASALFPDGVFFVPLAGLSEPERLLPAVAEVLGLRLEHGARRLFAYLQDRHLLLVLDNFEHLLDAVDRLDQILAAGAGIKLLVTSRERLRLREEQLFPIQGLPTSDQGQTDDARQLFLVAARRIRPDFRLTDEMLPAVGRICRQVEGMPLALELAAAWVDLLTPADIAAEIQESLDLLESDVRDIPIRHRSMRAVFDTSWQRLSAGSQRLLAKVTIFRGGFTRQAAVAVAGASLRDLAGLVNKSLLSFNPSADRYHIHELLRLYGANYLSGDKALRDRHCTYYFNWLQEQAERLHGPEQVAAVAEIQAEMDNLYAAVSHALGQVRPTGLAAAVRVLGTFFRVRGSIQDGITMLERVFLTESDPAALTPEVRFWTAIWLADLHGVLDLMDQAERYCRQAADSLTDAWFAGRDTRVEQRFLLTQGGYMLFQKEPAAAVVIFRESAILAEALADPIEEATALMGLTRAARNAGDLATARKAAIKALALYQEVGDVLNQIQAEILLANLALVDGRFAEAETLVKAGIEKLRPLNNLEMLGWALWFLADSQAFNGRFVTSLETDRERQRVGAGLGNPLVNRGTEAWILLHLGEYALAEQYAHEVLKQAQGSHEPRESCEAFVILGCLALVKGDAVTARNHFQAGRNVAVSMNVSLRFFSSQFYMALATAAAGDTDKARELLVDEIREAYGQRVELRLALALAGAAFLSSIEEQPVPALMLYDVARQQPFVANSRWFEDVVGSWVAAAAEQLPPAVIAAAQKRGQVTELWTAAEDYLEQ